jgi:PAS domain S-box-containing protein
MVNLDTDINQITTGLDVVQQLMAELEQLAAEAEYPEQLLKSLFLNLPAAFYVVQDGVFKFASPQLRQITSYADDELIGTSPLKLVLHDDRDVFNKHTVKLLKGGEPFIHEFRLVTKNGKIKWAMEATAQISYQGKQAIIANLLDITGHKEADKTLGKSEEKYRDLCENAIDMILCITPGGRIMYANLPWRETLGYSEDEISGLSLFDIIHRDYREHYLELFQQVISGEIINDTEVVFIGKNGNEIPVEGNVNCKFVEDKPVYTRGIFRNIAERKRTQEDAEALLKDVKEINRRLEQSNRELEDFAYIASHDLQEPLRKISSFGALLKDSLTGRLDEDQCENLDYMVDGARRMQLMIDDMLAYSRITTRAKPFQPVDITKVVEDLKKFELAAALEDTKGIVYIPQPLLTVHGDPSQIYQILQNLIVNGLKFHRDGIRPLITIRSSPMQDNMVRIYVQDNGIGIEEEYYEQIFVMFKRLHPRTSYQGNGIGLAICKKIVQRHNGEIGIKSTPGDGSTFWFTLPRTGQSEDNYPGGSEKSE